jgi:nitroreductase
MIGELMAVIRSRLPKSVKRWLRLIATYPIYYLRLHQNYAYDRNRFGRYSSADSIFNRQVHLQSWIAGDAHKIEKALSLRSPRPGFGVAVVSRLVENLERHFVDYGTDEICVTAIDALKEYVEYNTRYGFENLELDKKLEGFCLLQKQDHYDLRQGGSIPVKRDDILRKSSLDLEGFFESRHSIRHFSDKPVPREMVERAIRLALKTPSVCNRQSWRVHAFSEPNILKEVIACQKGNAGFGEQIRTVLVVTSNTETFFSVGERNQCWIDGGMFSMSLVYALHSLGLGSICLNWSVERAADRELHRVASIPDPEAIIMLIGIGFLPETLRVAQSKRKLVDDILIWGK